jgi:hypothetical protein
MAPVLTDVVVGDPPEVWAAAGFAVPDRTVVVGDVRLRLTGGDGAGNRGVRGWSFSTVEADGELDGLVTTPSGAPEPVTAAHPNGVQSLDHIVVLTPDTDRTTAAFTAAGLDVRRVRPTDRGGTPRVQVFFRAGEAIIELVGPVEPTGEGPARFYGLAFTVGDADGTGDLLGDRLSPFRPAVQPGRRIATLRTRELGISVPVAFLTVRDGSAPTSEASPT